MMRGEGHLCFGLTEAGKMILRGIVFVALAALIIPAFDVLSVLVCVMLVALVVGFVLRPRILVAGNLPERILAGQAAELTYTIRNFGRLPAYNLRLRYRGLPEAIEQTAEAPVTRRLGPGQTTEITLGIRPRRRGCYRIQPPVCESGFPFNLFRFGRAHQGEEVLLVLPAFSRLDLPLPYVSRHVNAASLRPAGRRGTSPEYVGNRPYQPGDPPRRIDVRAWARLAVPATKEYDDDLDNFAAIILDTRGLGQRQDARAATPRAKTAAPGKTRASRPRRSKPERDTSSAASRELEAAVTLCASVAYTIHRDCLIDLLLAGPELHPYTPLPKALRLDRIQETLAVVEPSAEYDAGQIGPLLEDRLGEISEIVFIVLRWDRTYQQLAQLAERAGCHCTIMVVGRMDQPEEEGGRRTEDGTQEGSPSAVIYPPLPAHRFISADEVLAGRGGLP
jgi:hypothetical protein